VWVRTDHAVTDSELVQLARHGEAAALGVLLERHRPSLYALALSILRNRAEADDVVQDTFLIALRRLDDLRDPAAAGAWLRGIVRNSCLMRIRRWRDLPREIPDRAVLSDSGPEAVLERLALRDWVSTALGELSADLRVTVLLRYFTKRATYADIADVLGIPAGTVRSRLNTAKRQIADSLLAAADTVHLDAGALYRERWEQWVDAIDEMNREGSARCYFADCTPDVVVDNPAAGYSTRGIECERRNVEEGLSIGVRLRPTRIVTNPGLTIGEATYENPPNDPQHCPPLHTEIRIHTDHLTRRLILNFGSDS
jgi:RNA polymerase sigma factor (sigma-70 family)